MDALRCRVFALLSVGLVTAIEMRPSAQSGHSLAAVRFRSSATRA
jgi:hypothetical protein